MSEITGKVNGGRGKGSTEDPPVNRHDDIHEKKQAGVEENNGNKERAKNLEPRHGYEEKRNRARTRR